MKSDNERMRVRRAMRIQVLRAASAVGLSACIVNSGCTSFYTAAPETLILTKMQQEQVAKTRFVRPEDLCDHIRGAAFSRRTEDTVFGTVLAAGGAGVAIVGAAEAGRTDGHTDGWTASWATMAGAGAAALAVGIYYLLRGGEDRAAYWTTNGAIANIQADYRSLPVEPPTGGKTAQEAALEAKRASMLAQAEADQASNKAKDADTYLSAVGNVVPKPSEKIQLAIDADGAAHSDATRLARIAQDKAGAAVLAQNYLAAEQAAWGHCAAALGSLSTSDAATNQGIVTSIGGAPGALK
jgi:hypothetical protein